MAAVEVGIGGLEHGVELLQELGVEAQLPDKVMEGTEGLGRAGIVTTDVGEETLDQLVHADLPQALGLLGQIAVGALGQTALKNGANLLAKGYGRPLVAVNRRHQEQDRPLVTVVFQSRFGERLRDFHADSVRAAGTSTIRRAREDSNFMREAEGALGHPIDIVSGLEEARLIYKGVTHSLPPTDGLRLVSDFEGSATSTLLFDDAGGTLDLKSLAIVDHPTMGQLRAMAPPARFGGVRQAVGSVSPNHGEHTDEVLSELGLDADKIENLRQEGVVG